MAIHLSCCSSSSSSACGAIKPFVLRAQRERPGPRDLVESGSVRPIRPSERRRRPCGLGERGSGSWTCGPRGSGRRPAWVGRCTWPSSWPTQVGNGPLTVLKRWVHFGYIGLWTGQLLTTMNDRFVADVDAVVPDKTTKLLVTCGEGLRSLIAVRLLHEGGYENLGWLVGGFNRCVDGDFPNVEGSSKLQYATIGGASYILLQLLLLLQVIGKESKER